MAPVEAQRFAIGLVSDAVDNDTPARPWLVHVVDFENNMMVHRCSKFGPRDGLENNRPFSIECVVDWKYLRSASHDNCKTSEHLPCQ